MYEYKVIPAPRQARRSKGARTVQDRFAQTLADTINAEAGAGWEFVRAESLPVEQKKNMLSSPTESYHSVLVFRRVAKTPARSPVSASPEKALTAALRVDPSDRHT